MLTIEHRVSAGQQYNAAASNAAAPTNVTPNYAGGQETVTLFAGTTAGGLIDPGHSRALRVSSLTISMGGQSAWQIRKLDQDGNVLIDKLLAGTTEASVLAVDVGDLAVGEKLALSTTGMTAPGILRVNFVPVKA